MHNPDLDLTLTLTLTHPNPNPNSNLKGSFTEFNIIAGACVARIVCPRDWGALEINFSDTVKDIPRRVCRSQKGLWLYVCAHVCVCTCVCVCVCVCACVRVPGVKNDCIVIH